MDDYLINVLNDLRLVNDSFQLYFNKIDEAGFTGSEPHQSLFITEHLAAVEKFTHKGSAVILKSYDLSQPEDLFSFTEQILEYSSGLTQIMQLFQNIQLNILERGINISSSSSISLSFVEETRNIFADISRIYGVYKIKIEEPGFWKALMATWKAGGNREVPAINALYEKYLGQDKGHYVIDLYILMLKIIIQEVTGKPEGREIIKIINKILETIKTTMLDTGIRELQQNKVTAIQRLMLGYNLVPAAPYREMTAFFKDLLDADIKKDPLTQLKKLAKTLSGDKKIGFLIIKRGQSNRIIEYNIWNLIDKEYLEARGIYQPAEVGINAQSLQRAETIHLLENAPEKFAGGGKTDLLFINEQHQGKGNDFYYILETPDEYHFRSLTPFSQVTNTLVPAEWYQKLEDKTAAPPARVEYYNQVLSQEILKYAGAPYTKIDPPPEEVRGEDIYWKKLRNHIKMKILEDFEKLLTNYRLEEIEKAMLDEKLYRNVLTHLIKAIQSEENIHQHEDYIRSEIFLSYFRDLDRISRWFHKDIDDVYRKKYAAVLRPFLPDKKEPAAKNALLIKNKILEVFSQVLEEVLEKYINRKNNLYLTVRQKLEIFSKTLNGQN